MKRLLMVVLVLLGLESYGQTLYNAQLDLLYKNTVPQIKAKELHNWQKQNKKVYLLDTRTDAEYQVSHLAGAHFVNYDLFKPDKIKNIPRQAIVVIYCAVGVRSERVGEQLLKAGYKNVFNLYGGIFAWKNAGYTVYNNQKQSTDSVHTYNRLWSVWLRNGIKVFE